MRKLAWPLATQRLVRLAAALSSVAILRSLLTILGCAMLSVRVRVLYGISWFLVGAPRPACNADPEYNELICSTDTSSKLTLNISA